MKTNDMKGIELVINECREQRVIHKHTVEDDFMYNSDGQLVEGALYCLTEDGSYYPKYWEDKFRVKVKNKNQIQKLVVSAALLIAEIDRLLFIEANNTHETDFL